MALETREFDERFVQRDFGAAVDAHEDAPEEEAPQGDEEEERDHALTELRMEVLRRMVMKVMTTKETRTKTWPMTMRAAPPCCPLAAKGTQISATSMLMAWILRMLAR